MGNWVRILELEARYGAGILARTNRLVRNVRINLGFDPAPTLVERAFDVAVLFVASNRWIPASSSFAQARIEMIEVLEYLADPEVGISAELRQVWLRGDRATFTYSFAALVLPLIAMDDRAEALFYAIRIWIADYGIGTEAFAFADENQLRVIRSCFDLSEYKVMENC